MDVVASVIYFRSNLLTEPGQIFREAREAKHISYEQIVQDLKIQPYYLEALEDEQVSAFPSMPMMRGFVRNYAQYLELDPQEMLALYDQLIYGSKQRRFRQPKKTSPVEISMGKSGPLINPILITFLLIVSLIGSIIFFAYTQYLEPLEAGILEAIPSAKQVEEQLAPAAVALALDTPTPLPTNTPVPTATPTPQYYTGVTVEVVVTERSWIQITLDGVKVFDGFLDPGDERRWDAEEQIAIRSGNAGGVNIYVNGEDMGLMGQSGQVVDQLWEKVDEADVNVLADQPTTTATPAP